MLSLRDEGSNALWRNFDVEQGVCKLFFNGRVPRPFLWADSQATREKIKISGIPNRINYCSIFIVYTQFTNVAADRVLETPGVEDHVTLLRLV